jgi:hypothetical protein
MPHVYPVNDEKEHDTESLDCWCNPRVLWGDQDGPFSEPVIVHNSADCRELIEQAEEIKKQVKI